MANVELSDALVTLATVDVTTGAAPVDVTIPEGCSRVNVNVTSGGTGGAEILNLPPLAELFQVGLLVVVALVAQADPGDVVHITADGSAEIGFTNALDGSGADPLILDYEDASAAFPWCGDAWFCDPVITDYNFNYTAVPGDLVLQAQGAGGSAELSGRSAAPGSDDDGGDAVLSVGAGDGAGRHGTIILNGLPDTDLMVTAGLYYDPITFVVKYHP